MKGMRAFFAGWGGPAILISCFFILILGACLTWKPSPAWLTATRNRRWSGTIPDTDGTGGPPLAVAIGLGLVVLGGGYWFFRVYTPRGADRPDVRPVEYQLATWVVLLDRGKHYDGMISGLASMNYGRLASRRLAAERLAASISPDDVLDGFALVPNQSRFHDRLAREAKRLSEEQAAAVAEGHVTPGNACLLLFTCTDLAVERVASDATPERLIQAMRISVAGHPGDHSVMFIRHRTLSEASGRRAVAALKADVLGPNRTV